MHYLRSSYLRREWSSRTLFTRPPLTQSSLRGPGEPFSGPDSGQLAFTVDRFDTVPTYLSNSQFAASVTRCGCLTSA